MLRSTLVVGFIGCAFMAEAQDLGGVYMLEGTNFDGSTYGGQVEIVISSDIACQITWISGKNTTKGTCMRSGTAFTAAYQAGEAIGLILYQLQPDGTLVGAWTISGADGVGVEVLSRKAV
jgi:hypothetical protein